MFKSFLRFIFGTATVQASGNTERLLNKVYDCELKIFNLKKTDAHSISFLIYTGSYNSLVSIAQSTKTDIKIIKRHGLAYLTRNYRKRYGFAVGGLIFAALLYISTLFVWNTEIKGCNKTTSAEITLMLENAGFSVGKLKSKLDIKRIENDFLLATDKISWISINLKGTTAYIEIREVEPPPEFVDASEPCSIYAARDGVIASINTYMGYSVVSVGDTVTAGDLIVTGNYTDKYGEEYKLHSYAKVMAYTTRSYTVTVPFKTTEHIKTGKSKNKYELKLTRFTLPLYFNKNILYNNYDKTTAEKILKIGKNFSLPLGIVKTTYSEVRHVEVVRTEDVALADAYEKLYDFEYNLVGITVTGRSYEKSTDENGVTVKVILECYEDIGVPGKLE